MQTKAGQPQRILQIGIGDETFGGVERMCLEWLKNIDRDKYVFDFLSPNGQNYRSVENEIKSLGGHLYSFGFKRDSFGNKIKYYRHLNYFLKTHHYKIIHINSGAILFLWQVARVCRKNKIPKIIIHSHNAARIKFPKSILVWLIKKTLWRKGTALLTCSELAGYAAFPKKIMHTGKITYLPNGIDLQKFKFNIQTRKQYRDKLGLKNRVVYGNVARFDYQKNHRRLIDIFAKIYQQNHQSRLLLVGEGPLLSNIKEYVASKNLQEAVIFLGARKDISELLSAMDFFILPSHFEGMPVVAVEAQASGLPIFYNSALAKEIKILNTATPISLDTNNTAWSQRIINTPKPSDQTRNQAYIKIATHSFDIKDVAKELEKIYAA